MKEISIKYNKSQKLRLYSSVITKFREEFREYVEDAQFYQIFKTLNLESGENTHDSRLNVI